MANNRQNPTRTRPQGSGGAAAVATPSPTINPKVLMMGVTGAVLALIVVLTAVVIGISWLGSDELDDYDISHNSYSRFDLAGDNFSLTNQDGYYNFFLNPLAKSTDDMLVYRGDDRVKKGCGGLSAEFVKAKHGTKGSLQWSDDTVSRNGRMVHVFPHVITCAAYINGQRVNLIYPGNSDTNLNGNGISGDTLYDTVRSIVTDTQSMQQAGEDVCNQFYGSPTGNPVFATREWKEVWSPRPDWELQPDPNQADVVEWNFSSSAIGGRFPMAKLHEIGKPSVYWVRLKPGVHKQVPAHFRYVPWNDCQ